MGKQLARGREQEPAFRPVADPADGSFVAETRHTLRNSPAPFQSFWQANGGTQVFGFPLSEQFQEVNQATGETYWVQYFERQRMEWHATEPDPRYRILLGLLGKEYAAANHASNNAFQPDGGLAILPEQMIHGFNVHLYGSDQPWQDRGRVFGLAQNAGVRWMRQQIPWMDMQSGPGTECYQICWGEMDAIVDEANRAGMKLMLNVVRAPSWATADGRNGVPSVANYPEFANFMGRVAERYRGKVQAYEIWNEHNLAIENSGNILTPESYVEMLSQVYTALKASDPNALVVSGGLASTDTNAPGLAISDTNYFRRMFALPGFRSHVDAIGLHIGGHLNPPDALWPDNPGPGPGWVDSRQFYFRHVEDIRQLMVDNGLAAKPIWITEFGWATENYTPGFEYGDYNSFEEQAQYTVRAMELGDQKYQPWLGAMFLWNMNFSVSLAAGGYALDQQASFSIVNPDWSPRPAYAAVKRYLNP
jgi:polysaccharide biosynthesis protein PslG